LIAQCFPVLIAPRQTECVRAYEAGELQGEPGGRGELGGFVARVMSTGVEFWLGCTSDGRRHALPRIIVPLFAQNPQPDLKAAVQAAPRTVLPFGFGLQHLGGNALLIVAEGPGAD
jgi:hypothetical protein